ncbi:helix-turn-helix transcriptional regulator [Methylomonas sp. AM2-LC]|uniref:helix-turn-helix domain-containing protein n=1 Tax=Methylomonas sp. AM2-LC TaxID=3153301 RepID=UPI003265E494
MQNKLNLDNISQKMTHNGLTQTALANLLDVSKEAVSQWLSHKAFPRPNKLLQLGKQLSLNFDELVIKENTYEPVVAFRKMKGTKTKDHHIEKAQEMGRFLKHLANYLPFDTLEMPPILKNPINDYDYLQKVVEKVRADIHVSPEAIIDFQHLIRRFNELQAVLIPILWGNKQRHENAVHIYLPDSETTWIYLNLDVNIHDFKFWMAHELGHCLAPNLKGELGEDFADAFAATLLFPEIKAKQAYKIISKCKTESTRWQAIKKIAEEETISPYTIFYQVNAFANYTNNPPIALKTLHAKVSLFNNQYQNVSQLLFTDNENITAKHYIETVKDAFSTPFFDSLSTYLKQQEKGFGFIQAILDMPILDAQSIYSELS